MHYYLPSLLLENGLRSYGTKPQIWDSKCENPEFEASSKKLHLTTGNNSQCKRKWRKEAEKEIISGYCIYKGSDKFSLCKNCSCIKCELGQELNFQMYIDHLVMIFEECRRVLKKEGSMFINISDSYVGTSDKGKWKDPKYKEGRNGQVKSVTRNVLQKSLLGIPYRLAIALIDKGFILRNSVIWCKPNAVPESVKDRFTRDYEYLFFFTKSKNYYFKQQFEPLKQISIERSKYNWCKNDKKASFHQQLNGLNREKYAKLNPLGRNMRTTWTVNTKSFHGKHYAGYPEALIQVPVQATVPIGGVILDPFFGSGTTGIVAYKNYANFIGIELNSGYIEISKQRFKDEKIPKIFGKSLPKGYLIQGYLINMLKEINNIIRKEIGF